MLNSQPTNIIKTKDRFDKSLGDNMYNTLKFKKKEEKKNMFSSQSQSQSQSQSLSLSLKLKNIFHFFF